ncbi:Cysteine synthase 2 [Leucoagaricus gongylophorus]
MGWLLAYDDWSNWLSQPRIRHTFYGAIIGISLSYTTFSFTRYLKLCRQRRQVEIFEARPIELRSDEIVSGATGLIGNTPLVRINSLSNALGVEILGKAEFLNPGGSVKDRVALQMIEDAEKNGLLRPYTGSRIFEGTVGSTGISIATIARARGYDATIIMPDDVAEEKVRALLALGAEVERVRPASIVDKKQVCATMIPQRESLQLFLPVCCKPKQCYAVLPRVTSPQNLARQRASTFTQKSDSSVGSYSHSTPHSVVVTTTTNIDLDHNGAQTKPRGYFADQFEASLKKIINTTALNSCK